MENRNVKFDDAITDIIRLMSANGIAWSDIRNGLNSTPAYGLFDIAVKTGIENITRLPLVMHQIVVRDDICGIYPFKDSDYYLELKECSSSDRDNDAYGKLPKEWFMRRLSKVIHPLNRALSELDAPELNGIYRARTFECNNGLDRVIVNFADDGSYTWEYSLSDYGAKDRYVVKPISKQFNHYE